MSARALPAIVCLSAMAAAQTHDFKIVPGERVGPITAASTLDDLKLIFGVAQVREQPIEIGEGFTEPGALIYPDKPSRTLAVIWPTSQRALTVFVCYGVSRKPTCEWKTREGIGFGTTLHTLERLNGPRFHLAGFAWDYGGAVISWKGGRLEALKGVWLELEPDPPALDRPGARQLYRQVSGDRVFSSGHPAMQALDPRVFAIHVTLPK